MARNSKENKPDQKTKNIRWSDNHIHSIRVSNDSLGIALFTLGKSPIKMTIWRSKVLSEYRDFKALRTLGLAP